MMIILAALLRCVPVYDCLIDGGWVTLGCTSQSPRPQQPGPDSRGSDPLRCLLTSIPHTLICDATIGTAQILRDQRFCMDVTPKSAGIETFGAIKFFSTFISNYLHVGKDR